MVIPIVSFRQHPIPEPFANRSKNHQIFQHFLEFFRKIFKSNRPHFQFIAFLPPFIPPLQRKGIGQRKGSHTRRTRFATVFNWKTRTQAAAWTRAVQENYTDSNAIEKANSFVPFTLLSFATMYPLQPLPPWYLEAGCRITFISAGLSLIPASPAIFASEKSCSRMNRTAVFAFWCFNANRFYRFTNSHDVSETCLEDLWCSWWTSCKQNFITTELCLKWYFPVILSSIAGGNLITKLR